MAVLVVTGVAREAKIAAGPGIATVCSGGAPARLRHILAHDDLGEIDAVVSFGIAGGLNPALMPGHIVVADAVVSHIHRWQTDDALTDAILGALHRHDGARLLRASVIGVDEALVDAVSKSASRARTGAAVVDMESHIAAEYAEAHGLPLAVIRAVCDPASRGLPPLVNQALKPDGKIDFRGVLTSLRREPGQIGDLIRLARDSRSAFRALETVAPVFRRAVTKPMSDRA